MRNLVTSRFLQIAVVAAAVAASFGTFHQRHAYGAASPVDQRPSGFRVVAPLESGNLLLFPVVQSGKLPGSQFITLDEGIKSGEVEVTEAGMVRGLIRRRPAQGQGRTMASPDLRPSIGATRSTPLCWSTTPISLCCF
jgi:hypothetical protein